MSFDGATVHVMEDRREYESKERGLVAYSFQKLTHPPTCAHYHAIAVCCK